MARPKTDFTDIKCDNIKDDGEKCENRLTLNDALREYNKDGNWTGKWLCRNCYRKINSKNEYRERYLCGHRTGYLDQNCNRAKGDNFEELTCKWRSTISVIPVENLNEKLDNYNTPIDHSRDSELGIIQTKGKFYDSYNKTWTFARLNNDHGKEFDNMVLWCANKNGYIIERGYIIPKREILKRTGITIRKDRNSITGYIYYDSKGDPYLCGWYEEYRIKDEDTIKEVNNIWKKIIDNRV